MPTHSEPPEGGADDDGQAGDRIDITGWDHMYADPRFTSIPAPQEAGGAAEPRAKGGDDPP